MDMLKHYKITGDYDDIMECREWAEKIPFLQFPSDWEVKAVPPFAGASVRYWIKKGDAFVSVYLDCYNSLGSVGKPYWEVYPYEDDTFRCYMNETDELMIAIGKSIIDQLS